MKILLFIDSLGAGGAQRQLVGLASMLDNKGYDVKVCTYHDYDFYRSFLDEKGIPNVIIPNATSGKKRILAVKSYFTKENPDWVIAYQETPSLVACAAKALGCKYKLIVSERNTTQHVGMNERVRFFLYHWADAIVPNSHTQEIWLSNHHPWMKKKLTTITNFVNLEKFQAVEHDRRELPEVMVAATIRPSKNTIGLIQAASILKERGLRFHISWYGYSDEFKIYYEECETAIKKLNLVDNVSLLPKTKEIHKKYQEADYFCLPSFYEGTPNVLCEAISCGLPVMVSNVCDNGYYALKDINGVLFNPSSPEDIASAVYSIMVQDNKAYLSCRENSRSIAERLLAENIFLEKYLNIIEGLCQK